MLSGALGADGPGKIAAASIGIIDGSFGSVPDAFRRRQVGGIIRRNEFPIASLKINIILKMMTTTISRPKPRSPYLIYDIQPVRSHTLFLDCTSITRSDSESLFVSWTRLSNSEKTFSCSIECISYAWWWRGEKSYSLIGSSANLFTRCNLVRWMAIHYIIFH